MGILKKHPTTISSWAFPLLEILKDSRISSDQLLANVGIDKAKLWDPDARIRVDKMNDLWKEAVRVTGNENIGLAAAIHVGPTTLHALGFALMVSDNLQDAFERLRRFYRIVSDTIELELETDRDLFIVSLNVDESRPHASKEALDMALAAIVLFGRMLLYEDINPVKVEFRRSRPRNTKQFIEIFKSPVLFNMKTNRIFFRLEDVNLKLPSANSEVARSNDEIVIDYLASFNKENTANRVHVKIIELLPLGELSVEKLARVMG